MATVQEIHKNETVILTNRKQSSVPEISAVPLIEQEFPVQIVWRNVGLFAYLHLATIFGLYLFVTGQVMWKTAIWGKISP